MTIKGTRGDDDLTGTGGNDTFQMGQGGNDTVHAGGGNDLILDYSGGLTFGATTIINVETLKLDSDHSYVLNTADGNVASGATLTVDASALSGSDLVNVDGSAETDGNFAFIAGNSSGGFTGGAGNDTYDLTRIGASVASFNALDSGGRVCRTQA